MCPQAEIEIIFLCPFCGGRVEAGYDEDGSGLVFHEIPQCKTFDEKNPADFLRSCRERMQN
jgi:hypothetical protein